MTTLDTKVQILHEFWIHYSTSGDYDDFIETHDIGIPLASCIVLGHAIATESGVRWIEDDYASLLDLLGVDPHGEYDSLDELMEIAGYEQG